MRMQKRKANLKMPADEEDNAPVEVLKPSRESAPEDVGEPLVLINDTG